MSLCDDGNCDIFEYAFERSMYNVHMGENVHQGNLLMSLYLPGFGTKVIWQFALSFVPSVAPLLVSTAQEFISQGIM